MTAAETRTVRDPSTGETSEVEEGPNPARAAVPVKPLPLPPPRLVVVDGIVRGEARLSTEVWDLLEGLGLSRQEAITAAMRGRQLPDRIVIQTGKPK